MQCTRIVLVRHGHTAGNGGSDHPVLSGTTDLPLTELGHRQASALAHSGALGGADHVYASPLSRALATAAPLAEHAGLEVVCRHGLEEIHCGELDGVEIDVVRTRFPTVWATNEAQTDAAFRWPGGESYLELRERSVATVNEIGITHRGARVVVVTHAGVISQLIGTIRGVPPARWSAFRVGNASITELDWGTGGGSVVVFDRRDHLPAALQS